MKPSAQLLSRFCGLVYGSTFRCESERFAILHYVRMSVLGSECRSDRPPRQRRWIRPAVADMRDKPAVCRCGRVRRNIAAKPTRRVGSGRSPQLARTSPKRQKSKDPEGACRANTIYIELGSPLKNRYCESFNARFRDVILGAGYP